MSPWLWLAVAVVLTAAAFYARRRTLRELLEREEGRVPFVYKDAAGLDTFGIGHKVLPNERDLYQYSAAKPAPDAIVEAYFDNDVRKAAAAVDQLDAGLTDGERAALVSLVFNIGVRAFEGSTIRKLILAGDKPRAADEFLKWKLAGGQPVLLARRERERDLFMGVA